MNTHMNPWLLATARVLGETVVWGLAGIAAGIALNAFVAWLKGASEDALIVFCLLLFGAVLAVAAYVFGGIFVESVRSAHDKIVRDESARR